MKDIQVVDDFFTEQELKIVSDFCITKALAPIKNQEGSFGFRQGFNSNENLQWVFKKIKDVFIKNKDLVVDVACVHLRYNHLKALPHTDKQGYNFICYVKGSPLFNNGTGFYKNNQLSMHVGFVENRALFLMEKIFFTLIYNHLVRVVQDIL